MFFPQPGTLGYSDAFLLDALVYVPLRWMGIDPFLSLELVCIVLSVVGFSSFNFLLVRFAAVRQPLAALAAGIFAFSNALYVALGHPQLLEANLLPAVAALLLEGARWNRVRPLCSRLAGFGGGALYALLFATGYYVAWFFGFLSAIALVSAGLFALGRGLFTIPLLRVSRPFLLAAASGFALGILPFLRIYAPVLRDFPSRPFIEYTYDAPAPGDLLNVGGTNLLWGHLLGLIHVVPAELLNHVEHSLAITPILVVTFLCSVALVWRNAALSQPEARGLRNAVLGIFFAVAIMDLAMLKFGHFSLFWLVRHLVPGAGVIRDGARSQIVSNGFVAAVTAIMLDRALRVSARRSVRLAIWGLVLICTTEQINLAPSHALSRATELAARAVVAAPPEACKLFYIAPQAPSRGDSAQHTDAMLIAQQTGVPTVNGYSGLAPPGWPLSNVNDPAYRARAWHWVERKRVAAGLCEYEVGARRWIKLTTGAEALTRASAVVAPGAEIDFGREGNGAVYEVEGWPPAEQAGTWTDGPRASIEAVLSGWTGGDMVLEIAARPYLVEGLHPSLQVEVAVNDEVIDRWSYHYGEGADAVRSARLPASLLAASSLLRIELRFDRPASPKSLGLGRDGRKLGLQVSHMALRGPRDEAGH